jgi:Fe-S cluster biosynthesis and repair protein YggX
MPEVACVRCGRTAGGLAAAPLPGPLGAGVLARVCAACWAAWMERAVMVVNERSIDLSSEAGSRAFDEALCDFLNLAPDGSAGPRTPGDLGPAPPEGYTPA